MEKAIKQRLLGGLVLVAGAALFLPILLDGSGSQLVVPPMPAAPRVPTVEAVAPGLEKQAQALDQSVAAAHGEPAAPVAAAEVSPDAAAAAPAAEPRAAVAVPAPAPKKEQAVPAPRSDAAPKKTAPVAAAAATDGLPQAWVVQVASLSGRDKADALVQKLRKKGFHGFVHHQGGEWKVLVGPELHKDVAESAKQRMATDPELRLNGWLQPWKP